MVPSSIGELATVCALLPAFRAHHGGKVCIVADSGKRHVLQLFADQVDAIKFVPLASMRALSTYRIINPLDFRVGVPQNLWINQNGDGRGSSLHELFISDPSRGGLKYIDMYRYAMRLPWDAPISPGSINVNLADESKRYADLYGIDSGNSVILFTGNNTNKPAPAIFWNDLSRKLTISGKKVFFNMNGGLFQPKGLDIEGTQIHLSTSLAIGVCEIAGHMISCPNGLVVLSLITQTNFDLDVLLTDRHDPTGVGNFVPLNPMAGSLSSIGGPELLKDVDRRYREWIITEGSENFLDVTNSIGALADHARQTVAHLQDNPKGDPASV
jgi:hypothetical protein